MCAFHFVYMTNEVSAVSHYGWEGSKTSFDRCGHGDTQDGANVSKSGVWLIVDWLVQKCGLRRAFLHIYRFDYGCHL